MRRQMLAVVCFTWYLLLVPCLRIEGCALKTLENLETLARDSNILIVVDLDIDSFGGC